MPCSRDLFENVIQCSSDTPARVVALHLAEITDVTDVVSFAVLIHVLRAHGLAGHCARAIERFDDAAGVSSPAAEIVDFSTARSFDEGFDEGYDVVRVDVVPHLLPLVTEDAIELFLEVALDEVTQEAV